MIKLKRSIMSDVLGLTNDKKDFFEVNDKSHWRKLAFKVSHLYANRTFDLWKNSDGSTRPVFSPSDEYLREKFKDEIDAVTKKGAYKITMPVTVVYPNGKMTEKEETVSFDTYEEMKSFISSRSELNVFPYYPFIKQDPVQFAKQVIGIDLDGDYKPDI